MAMMNRDLGIVPPPDRPHPPPIRPPRTTNTNTKVEVRTTFRTIRTITRTRGPTSSRQGPSLIFETSYDVTSFLPRPTSTTQTASRTSTDPTTTLSGDTPSSTSSSNAAPTQATADGQGSSKPSTAVVAVLAVLGAIIILGIGIYLGRRFYKKRKPPRPSENDQSTAAGARDNDPHGQSSSSRGQQHYVAKRLSEYFFAPSFRATLQSVPPKTDRDIYSPPRITREPNVPYSPPEERIPMGDFSSPESRQPTDLRGASPSPSPSNPYPYMEVGQPRRDHARPPHNTATTIGSLLNYYQSSGNEARTQGYERISSGLYTPSRPLCENSYRDRTPGDLENGPEIEHDHRRLYNGVDDFRSAPTTYGHGSMNRVPSPYEHRDMDGTASTSSRSPTSRPTQTIFTESTDFRHPGDASDVTSEYSHNPFLDTLKERYGPAEHQSIASTMWPIAEDAADPAMRSRLEALEKLEYGSRHRESNDGLSRNGWGEGIVEREAEQRLDTSTADFSDLRPSPLRIRKADSTSHSSDSVEGPPHIPEQRTGYEEYMGNPYRNDIETPSTEQYTPLHIHGSYETWAREQRRERSERAAGQRYAGAINHTRGESSGTQPSRSLYPLAEHSEDDFNPVSSTQQQAQAHHAMYEAHGDAINEYDNAGEYTAVESRGRRQNLDIEPGASREWYHRIRDRLRTQTPELNRFSQIYRRTDASREDVNKGKGVADDYQDGAYTYASAEVNDGVSFPRMQTLRAGKVPADASIPGTSHSTVPTAPATGRLDTRRPQQPPTTAEHRDDSTGRDVASRETRSRLRKKTSAGWKRLSGRFRKGE